MIKLEINEKKNFLWNLIGTSFNAFASLFYMIILTRVNGLEDAGIFSLAFSIACLLCNIGGYEGRVYQVTDAKKEFTDKEYIVHRFITAFIMMVIAIAYVIFMQYSLEKSAIVVVLCMTKCLEVVADVFYGILQKNNRLYNVGISLTTKSIVSITLFFGINYIFHDLLVSCISMCVVWGVILISYDVPKTMKYINKQEDCQIFTILQLFKSGFFSFAIIFLSVYLSNAPKYALDGRVNEALQAIYGIIIMPGTIISLSAQYIMHPFLPNLSKSVFEKKRKTFKKIMNSLIFALGLIAFAAILCAYFLGIPVLSFVYSVDLTNYKFDLIIVMFGACCSAGCMIISAALTTLRKTFIQFIIYVVVAFCGMMISPILIESIGLRGAVWSYFLIMASQMVLYEIIYRYMVLEKKWRELVND